MWTRVYGVHDRDTGTWVINWFGVKGVYSLPCGEDLNNRTKVLYTRFGSRVPDRLPSTSYVRTERQYGLRGFYVILSSMCPLIISDFLSSPITKRWYRFFPVACLTKTHVLTTDNGPTITRLGGGPNRSPKPPGTHVGRGGPSELRFCLEGLG